MGGGGSVSRRVVALVHPRAAASVFQTAPPPAGRARNVVDASAGVIHTAARRAASCGVASIAVSHVQTVAATAAATASGLLPLTREGSPPRGDPARPVGVTTLGAVVRSGPGVVDEAEGAPDVEE